MKIRHTVTVSINLTQNPSVWLCERGFVVCRPTDFLTGARIRSQKMWENSWTQKKSKIDSPIFQDKCKKNYPWSGHRRVSVKRQFFSPVSIKLRYWDDEYMNQSYIKIAGWRNKSTEDHDSYKYAIYAVGKRKPGALPLLRYTDLFFSILSSTLLLQSHFTF